MATFYEIYQNYLQNPYGGVNALPGVNAISGTMGATPISSMSGGDGIGEVSSVSPVGSVSNVGNVGGFGNVDTSAKGIAGLAASAVLGGPAGLALNIGGQMIGMPSVSEYRKQWVLVVLAERIVILLLLEFLVEMIHRQQEQLMQQILETWDQKPLIMQLWWWRSRQRW
jgi:hypothetical protein